MSDWGNPVDENHLTARCPAHTPSARPHLQDSTPLLLLLLMENPPQTQDLHTISSTSSRCSALSLTVFCPSSCGTSLPPLRGFWRREEWCALSPWTPHRSWHGWQKEDSPVDSPGTFQEYSRSTPLGSIWQSSWLNYWDAHFQTRALSLCSR